MPGEFYRKFVRLKIVEREYGAIRFAADELLRRSVANPALLGSIQLQDLKQAIKRLEGTYLVRLFAEFESSLRVFWALSRSTQPRTRDLIDGVGSLAGVPLIDKANAHSVRAYRNSLIHQPDESVPSVRLEDARSYLSRFFRHLALRWK